MMIRLKYKELEFPQNPAAVTVKWAKDISERSLLSAGSAVEEIAQKAAKITASGKLFGKDGKKNCGSTQRSVSRSGRGAADAAGRHVFLRIFFFFKHKGKRCGGFRLIRTGIYGREKRQNL